MVWKMVKGLSAVLKQAMQQQQVSAEKLQGIWVDVGTPERLEQLDQQIKQNKFRNRGYCLIYLKFV